mmetsp:Transcript_14708/g.37287  ORF Transcript_14708/g.37287 Transcript_14708/m.37287 type:complete len:256 (-) Transcript_14708:78-845(-)
MGERAVERLGMHGVHDAVRIEIHGPSRKRSSPACPRRCGRLGFLLGRFLLGLGLGGLSGLARARILPLRRGLLRDTALDPVLGFGALSLRLGLLLGRGLPFPSLRSGALGPLVLHASTSRASTSSTRSGWRSHASFLPIPIPIPIPGAPQCLGRCRRRAQCGPGGEAQQQIEARPRRLRVPSPRARARHVQAARRETATAPRARARDGHARGPVVRLGRWRGARHSHLLRRTRRHGVARGHAPRGVVQGAGHCAT